MFEESPKSKRVFRTQASIYDGTFKNAFLKCLMVYYFCNISSIIYVRVSYIWASKNIKIFNLKLSWSKVSRLLQLLAFLVHIKGKCFFGSSHKAKENIPINNWTDFYTSYILK